MDVSFGHARGVPSGSFVIEWFGHFKSQIVVILVTLLTGKTLCAPSMSADGDHLIRIVGEDSRKQRHKVVVGFASFQYEILSIELPPPIPKLKIV